MSKYLITGITGFAGPNLANFLIDQNQEVYGLVRCSSGREQDIRDVIPDKNFQKITFLYGDFTRIRDMKDVFKNNKFDGVFHLGAQSHPPTSFKDPEGTRLTNVIGTENIMNSLATYQKDCALMFCSTSEVYGAVPEEKQPINEDFLINPINPYGLSKAISDVDVRGRAKIFDLPFFVTRAFSHTGLRRGKKFSISSDAYQIARIKAGLQEPTISVGTLSSKRVVMDARDCVRAYYYLMERAIKGDKEVSGEAFNVGGDELFSIGELLNNMLKISGLEGKVSEEVNPKFVRPVDIPIQICDTKKVRELTNWKPEISIVKKTLPDLLDYWYKKVSN